MTLTLPKTQERVVKRLVRSGKFRDTQAVLREALRRLARDPDDFLNPPPLTTTQIEAIYGPNPEAEAEERAVGTWAAASLRRAAKRGRQL